MSTQRSKNQPEILPVELAFDIGNSEIGVAVFNGRELRTHWRLCSDPDRTVDEYGVILLDLLRGIRRWEKIVIRWASIASVVPRLTRTIMEVCARKIVCEARVIDGGSFCGLRLDVDDPAGVGADRIANGLGALYLHPADCIVVDFGTATTFDCVTASRIFLGGAIAPGIRTGADQLLRRTAQLPAIELQHPTRAIGKNTAECLQSGIVFGAVDAVDGMVDRLRAEWGAPHAIGIATGGLAPLIAPHCRSIQHIEPTLTLEGVRLAGIFFEGANPGGVFLGANAADDATPDAETGDDDS